MAENLVIEPRPTVGAEVEEAQLRIADILPMVQHTIRQEEAPVWRSPRRPRQLEDDPVWDFTATPTSGDALKYRPIELGGEDLMGLLAGGGAAGWGAAQNFSIQRRTRRRRHTGRSASIWTPWGRTVS